MEKRRTKEQVNEQILLVYVQAIRKQQPRIGTRKLHTLLKEVYQREGIKYGRDKLFRLLRSNGLLVKVRGRHIRTTDSAHGYELYGNLIRDYLPAGAEQIWVSDITYIETQQGFVYLSLVTDQYSKKIMGYQVEPRLETSGPLKALRMALRGRTHQDSPLIHHSDRGVQYCCTEYTAELKRYNIQISMSARGNPYENAIAERVNGILKTEFYLDRRFHDIHQVRAVVKEVISIYNTQRPHASCNYLTPEQAHTHTGQLKRVWKEYKPSHRSTCPQQIGEEVKKVLNQLIRKNTVQTSLRE